MISSGSATLFSSVFRAAADSNSAPPPPSMLVLKGPGAIALTRMPRGASSLAVDAVACCSAALADP
jgi:hypothetical protein